MLIRINQRNLRVWDVIKQYEVCKTVHINVYLLNFNMEISSLTCEKIKYLLISKH